MGGLKYALIFFLTLTLILKVSLVISCIKLSNTSQITNNQEETEKENNKIEFLVNQTISNSLTSFYFESEKPMVILDGFFHISYYPEVLTPPPSLKA